MRPIPIVSSVVLALTFSFTQPAFAKLEVHEWGTFTSLVGSNGVTQNGMYHEDEALPGFVHGFGEMIPPLNGSFPPVTTTPEMPTPSPVRPRPCHSKACFGDQFLSANVITQKMETPVLYFYSDRFEDVTVNVKFPKGLITETFPAPFATFPTRADLKSASGGDVSFRVGVQAPSLPSDDLKLPYVDVSNIYSHARNVRSNLLISNGEREKFIFYRGIGQYQPDFQITSEQGALSLSGLPGHVPQASFLIDVDAKGEARLRALGNFDKTGGYYVSQNEIALLRDHEMADDQIIVSGTKANQAIIRALVNAGLYPDEAFAMVATWEHGYLKVPGLRLLSILP